jgi:hypothetical protein
MKRTNWLGLGLLFAVACTDPTDAPEAASLQGVGSTSSSPRLSSAVGTSFVMYFELEDFSAIAGTLNNVSLSNSLKSRARPFLSGGLSTWATSPIATTPPGGTTEDFACPLCHAVTIVNGGSVKEFVQLLYDVRSYFISIGQANDAFEYMAALANNIMPDANNNGIADDPIAWYGATEPAP